MAEPNPPSELPMRPGREAAGSSPSIERVGVFARLHQDEAWRSSLPIHCLPPLKTLFIHVESSSLITSLFRASQTWNRACAMMSLVIGAVATTPATSQGRGPTQLDAGGQSTAPLSLVEMARSEDRSGSTERWSAWTPMQPALQSAHERCHWHRVKTGHRLCLRDRDRVSHVVRERGEWGECSKLVRHLQSLPAARRKGAVFLELGANIGVCTLEVLMQTEATVIAFEPSPANLFYLTSSLSEAAKERADVASRVVVYPLAADEHDDTSSTLYAARGNAGNSVVGMAIKDTPDQDMNETYTIRGSRVGTVLSRSLQVELLKVDVQGFE